MHHPKRDLLMTAANDVDARFYCKDWNHGCHVPIQSVISFPEFDWKLVDKFAELKNAYAEGKDIQYRYQKGGNPTPQYMWSDWMSTVGEPQWDTSKEYRIKPEPIYEWQWIYKSKDGIFHATVHHYTSKEQLDEYLRKDLDPLCRIEESMREVKLPLGVEE